MNELAYRVGGLLYMPAIQENAVEKIKNKEIPYLTSAAFCLEDAIADSAVEEAEIILHNNLQKLKNTEGLPNIFIRVRNPRHLKHILDIYSDVREIINGYILPKFDELVADEYLDITKKEKINIMPIMESPVLADSLHRNRILYDLKKKINSVSEQVVNIRVGCNDLSRIYSLKCPINYTVYDLAVIRDIIIDILAVFSKDYVVSGAVFNYFADSKKYKWLKSFQKELELDSINGFVGKTAIHPNQLPYIYESLCVDKDDYLNAEKLINWQNEKKGVSLNSDGTGMNELKCHLNWAKKIYKLGNIYGIKGE